MSQREQWQSGRASQLLCSIFSPPQASPSKAAVRLNSRLRAGEFFEGIGRRRTEDLIRVREGALYDWHYCAACTVADSEGSVRRQSTRDQRPHFFTEDDALQVMWFEQIENDDGHLVVHAETEGGRIHDLELLLQGFEIGDAREALRFRILLRITVVDAVH